MGLKVCAQKSRTLSSMPVSSRIRNSSPILNSSMQHTGCHEGSRQEGVGTPKGTEDRPTRTLRWRHQWRLVCLSNSICWSTQTSKCHLRRRSGRGVSGCERGIWNSRESSAEQGREREEWIRESDLCMRQAQSETRTMCIKLCRHIHSGPNAQRREAGQPSAGMPKEKKRVAQNINVLRTYILFIWDRNELGRHSSSRPGRHAYGKQTKEWRRGQKPTG